MIPYLILGIIFLVFLLFVLILCCARICCFSSQVARFEPGIGESGGYILADPSTYPIVEDAMRPMGREGRWLGSIGTTTSRADDVLSAGANIDRRKSATTHKKLVEELMQN